MVARGFSSSGLYSGARRCIVGSLMVMVISWLCQSTSFIENARDTSYPHNIYLDTLQRNNATITNPQKQLFQVTQEKQII